MHGVHFCDLSPTLSLVEFDDTLDKERMQLNGPWSFDKQLVIMQEIDRSKQVHQIKIHEATFWVQIHDLQLQVRNKYVGTLVGEKIGRV